MLPQKVKDTLKISAIPVVIASLCCLSPLILVLLGLSTVSFAASLSDVLYRQYAWVFRIAGLVLLAASLVVYFRNKGICTIDEAKKRRNEIINSTLIVLITAVISYVVFLYGVVEYAGVLAGVWGAPGQTQSLSQPQTQTAAGKSEAERPRKVSFLASDGYPLKGVLWISAQASAPAVILVHQFGSDRHDFDSFAPVLLSEGYTVLAYDIRGFGESRSGTADINDFPKDVEGAVTFLKSQTSPSSKIAIVGASVGANVAFVASGSIPDISAAVSLSPSNTGPRGVLLGHDIAGFDPHAIFVASDEREQADADFIFRLSRGPKEQKSYPGFGHGVGLLRSIEARTDIIRFLRTQLQT